jgi:hypothetical protein
MQESEIRIDHPGRGQYATLTATYRQIAAVFGGGVVPESERNVTMAQWFVQTRRGAVRIYDCEVGMCCKPDGLELGQITQWRVDGNPDAIDAVMDLLTGDHPVRRHIIKDVGEAYGLASVEALERAMVHSGIEHLDPQKASRLATACWLAEDTAMRAVTDLIDYLTEMRDSIMDPTDVAPDKDSRPWSCKVSAGEMDELVVAMHELTTARNAARGSR